MIQYIYFVKCPNCEDEPFDFFDEAKAYALGCLSTKPIITQVEVNRDDFGCCTDSCDLGTIWSYEDALGNDCGSKEDNELSTFTKSETFEISDDDFDEEFEDDEITVTVGDTEIEIDDDEIEIERISDDERKPIPEDMTIKDLVEAMEENEEMVECTWCEDLFEKSECRYEVNLGWLCDRCQAAIMSRGEPLTFRENSYWDFLDEDTSSKESSTKANPETIDLEYEDIEVTIGQQVDVDEWDEETFTQDYIYTVTKDDVITLIVENFLTDDDIETLGYPGGFEAWEGPAVDWKNPVEVEAYNKWWEEASKTQDAFINKHFDTLFAKYEKQILDYYEEDAIEACQEDAPSLSDYRYDQLVAHAEAEWEARREDQMLRDYLD